MRSKPAHAQNTPQSPTLPGDPAQPFFHAGFEEVPLWTGLFNNLRDTIFPPHFPPLELTSTPVPMPDRMAAKTNPWAVGAATLMNAAVLALILLGLRTTIGHPPTVSPRIDVAIKDFTLFAPPASAMAHGGGGGGSHDSIDPIVGRTPKPADMPLVPPQVPLIKTPALAVEPAIAVPIDMKLPDNPAFPNPGVHTSINVKLVSSGPGSHAGIGTGDNGGDGPGKGPGYGPGSDRGFGGAVYTPGVGGVSKPIAIAAPDAEFSDEARRQHYQGVCIVSIIVDAQGNPRNPQVTRSLGMGLDEKALDAVRKYRFKPATKNGKPVSSYVSVEISFNLY